MLAWAAFLSAARLSMPALLADAPLLSKLRQFHDTECKCIDVDWHCIALRHDLWYQPDTIRPGDKQEPQVVNL